MNNAHPDNNELIEKPRISIVLPIYNAGEHLRPCLDTLVNQTLRNIEIICVLDCPTDGSDKVVNEYAARDNRFVVIRNERNLHIGESRNVGIRAARGEYIGFSDHDDTHELVMYEKLNQQTFNNTKDVVLSGKLAHLLSRKNYSKANNIIVDWAKATFFHSSYWLVTTHLYKKTFLSNNNIYFDNTKQLNGEDGLFNLHVLCKIQGPDNLSMINEDFYHHILHDNNESSNPKHQSFQKTICFLSKAYDLLKNGQSNLSPDICYFGMSILTIKAMYTQFREDLKKGGLKNAIPRIKQTFNSNAFIVDTLKSTSIMIPHIPPTKRVFLILIKLMLRLR